MQTNPAFFVALVVGSLMLVAVCFVYVRHRTFGLGGITLSGLGVILLGMSVWRSIDVSFDEKGMRAKLNQVEVVATEAKDTAVKAQSAVVQTNQVVAGLKTTVEVAVLQEKLKAAGLYAGASDGHFGTTKAALLKYQAANGLPQSGELDERTKRVLQVGSTAGIVR